MMSMEANLNTDETSHTISRSRSLHRRLNCRSPVRTRSRKDDGTLKALESMKKEFDWTVEKLTAALERMQTREEPTTVIALFMDFVH